MFDYSDPTSKNPLLGGICAKDILWKGAKTKCELRINGDGIINHLQISYIFDEVRYDVNVKLVITDNAAMLFVVRLDRDGLPLTDRELYLDFAVNEKEFARAIRLMTNRAKRDYAKAS